MVSCWLFARPAMLEQYYWKPRLLYFCIFSRAGFIVSFFIQYLDLTALHFQRLQIKFWEKCSRLQKDLFNISEIKFSSRPCLSVGEAPVSVGQVGAEESRFPLGNWKLQVVERSRADSSGCSEVEFACRAFLRVQNWPLHPAGLSTWYETKLSFGTNIE